MRRRQSGITLIEVLVSVLIMGLALISLAGLQSYTVKYQLGSANRAVLAMLVGDYAERVRANLAGAPGSTPPQYLFTTPWEKQATAPKAASVDCAATVCTDANTLAEWDMSIWRQRVREGLPRGSVRITGTAATGLAMTLMWQDNDFSASAPVCAADPTPADARQCCPVELPAGVRCANFLIVP